MKKLIGLVAVLMLFGITNASAITVDDIEYPGSNVTVEQDPNTKVYTLTLTGPAIQDLIIRDGEEVVLDLNGNLLVNFTLSCEAIKVETGGKLTIVDNSANQGGRVTHVADSTYGPITNLGTLIIEGGTFAVEDSFYVIRNEGTAIINGGTFTSTSTDTSLIGNIRYVDETVTPVLTIEDGTFTAVSNTVKNNENSEVTINGGTFTSENAFALDNSGTAVVNGGELTSTNNSAIRNIINNVDGSTTSLKVAENAVLTSGADKENYTIYDATLAADVTEDYDVTLDEDGNIVLTEKEEIDTPVEPDEPVTPSEPEIENPSTSDNVLTYAVLGGISLVGIAGVSLYLKKRNN